MNLITKTLGLLILIVTTTRGNGDTGRPVLELPLKSYQEFGKDVDFLAKTGKTPAFHHCAFDVQIGKKTGTVFVNLVAQSTMSYNLSQSEKDQSLEWWSRRSEIFFMFKVADLPLKSGSLKPNTIPLINEELGEPLHAEYDLSKGILTLIGQYFPNSRQNGMVSKTKTCVYITIQTTEDLTYAARIDFKQSAEVPVDQDCNTFEPARQFVCESVLN